MKSDWDNSIIAHLVPLHSWHGVAEDLEHDEEVLLLAARELFRRLGHEPRIGLGLLIGARLEGRRGPVKTLKAEEGIIERSVSLHV